MIEQLNIPSPVHRVAVDWAEAHDVALWMKRDDLIHPIVSGNKWRKLSGILQANTQNKVHTYVTYGGAFSNHLVATACTAAMAGVQSKALVRGEEVLPLNPVLQLCKAYGMELEFVSRTAFREIKRRSGVEEGVLYVPEGGACEEGTLGCEEIVKELNGREFDQYYVSCGTGTTLAGMGNYLKRQGQLDRLIGVQVLKGENYIAKEVQATYGLNITVLDQYHWGGYAKTTDELIDFAKDFAQQTGVLLDPIYTAKMMWAIKNEVSNGNIAKGSKVLAVHTGGLTGWFGKFQ